MSLFKTKHEPTTQSAPHSCTLSLKESAICRRCNSVQRTNERMWCRVCAQSRLIRLDAWAELQPRNGGLFFTATKLAEVD